MKPIYAHSVFLTSWDRLFARRHERRRKTYNSVAVRKIFG